MTSHLEAAGRGTQTSNGATKALPLAAGADRPDGAIHRPAVGLGVQPIRLDRDLAGVLLDRSVPDLHPVAALDLKFGRDGQNAPEEVMEYLENDRYYRYCTYMFIPATRQRDLRRLPVHRDESELAWILRRVGLAAKIGLALTVGMLGGTGINAAHEMGHKKDSLERWLAKITLGADLVRPFLHRTQPRPSRPGGNARGSGISALRRDLLGVPAAKCGAASGRR